MTHDSEIARFCTRLHGDVLVALLEGDASMQDIVGRMTAEMRSDFPYEAAVLRRAVTRPCQSHRQLVDRYAAGHKGAGYGFYVPETLAMAYDIFLGAEGDMMTAVYRAANLGGDSDSVASIVAAMAVCASGGEYVKPHDMPEVHAIDQIGRISEELARSALRMI